MDQNEINVVSELVEQYVGDALTKLAAEIDQHLTNHANRITALETVSNQAIYKEYIKNESVRLGICDDGAGDSDG